MDTVSSKAAAAGVLQDSVEVCVRPMQTINLFMLLGKHSKLNWQLCCGFLHSISIVWSDHLLSEVPTGGPQSYVSLQFCGTPLHCIDKASPSWPIMSSTPSPPVQVFKSVRHCWSIRLSFVPSSEQFQTLTRSSAWDPPLARCTELHYSGS